MYTSIHIHTYTYMHIYIYIHTHVYIPIHIYIYVYIWFSMDIYELGVFDLYLAHVHLVWPSMRPLQGLDTALGISRQVK